MEQRYVIQKPLTEGNWLYFDSEEKRLFSDIISRNPNSEHWLECTESEMLQWKSEHKKDYPEDFPEESINEQNYGR